MSLVVFTGFVGMMMAPGTVQPWMGLVAILCIAVGAGASGAINMGFETDIDTVMSRTQSRPTVQGRIPPQDAIIFGAWMASAATGVMTLTVGLMAGALLALSVFIYVGIYTLWLKRRSPYNIVIGGAAGALPPMIGWAAVTGGVSWQSFWLFMIIFLWTPPHFWALSLTRSEEYARAGVPMLPVVAGDHHTKWQIFLYTLSLLPTTLALYLSGGMHVMTLLLLLGLGSVFCWSALRLLRDKLNTRASRVFGLSILYLFVFFAVLLGEHLLTPLIGKVGYV